MCPRLMDGNLTERGFWAFEASSILEAGLARGDELFHLVALVVTASILAHSSTDVVIARWFEPGTGPGDTAPTPGSTC